jgi:regulator of protease activity HflC (stomatin/prohibitin superfamily)
MAAISSPSMRQCNSISGTRAWHYRSQSPADALRAIAYRAVMRNTVNRTLADALSENVVTTTARMREMVQQDADALDLGIEVQGFTVGGMHPPVAEGYVRVNRPDCLARTRSGYYAPNR